MSEFPRIRQPGRIRRLLEHLERMTCIRPALELKKIFFRKHFCTSWLLGIKFTQQISYELATKFNVKFEKIKETLINKFVLKNLGQRIEAESEVKILVLKRNELANW